MIARVVAWSARHHRIVIAAALVLAIGGERARRAVRRDVVPDLADPQIVVAATWTGHAAPDVAEAVTRVLTGVLDGVPGATAVRGSSMSDVAFVDVVFASAPAAAAGRRAIVERVRQAAARLPATARIDVGPAASSTGWVFQYALIDPAHGQPPRALRRLQDDIIGPALAAIPGVAEVASVGGAAEEVLVEVQGERLAARGLAFSDVLSALGPPLAARPAGSVGEIEALPIAGAPGGGAAARVADVARVRIADHGDVGVADLGGVWPAIGGIVVAERSADVPALIGRVRAALDRERARLPRGVRLVTVYDRLDLIDRVGDTLARALVEEVAMVALVILVFLLHLRSALIPLATLPWILLSTFAAMWALDVPATIMSVGGIGIALGMAVDADVVALEACHRRLESLPAAATPAERRAALLRAAGSFAPAILTTLLIAALAFLPVFAFTGETGRLLRPLALTKTLVVVSAAVVSLTLAPALRDRLLRGRVRPELDNPLTRRLVRAYRPLVLFALARPALTLATAGLAVASCVPIVLHLGAEFLPRVDEGDLLFMPTTLPGVSAHQAATDLRRQDRAIAAFKEVATVFGKAGRATTATDLAPMSMVETTIRLLPRAEWPTQARRRWYSGWAPAWLRRGLGLVWPEQTPATPAELVASLDRATRLPGWSNAWTTPVRARMDMMSTGVPTPVGIRIVAPDTARLEALGSAMRELALRIPGTRAAVFESLGGETRLAFVPEPVELARHRVDAARARATADLVLAGGELGQLARGAARLRVRVVPEQNVRGPADALRDVTVRAATDGTGQPVPLALLGRPQPVTRPSSVRAERGEQVAYVYVDVDVDLAPGTDLTGYVDRARRELERALAAGAVKLGPRERIEWAGQYQLLAAGTRRLTWIVPAVALSMLLLLLLQLRSLTEALIVLAAVPFALVGSFWTLFALGYPLSAPVWVGLLSVVGLAMQTGVVTVVYIDAAFHRRVRDGRLRTRDDIVAAHAEGTVLRLRPKIMTVTTMAASLLPLLWAQGAGAEIFRRVAAPMLGGLASSAFLTLEVLPVLYTMWRHSQLRRAQRNGETIAAVIGPAPPWASENA